MLKWNGFYELKMGRGSFNSDEILGDIWKFLEWKWNLQKKPYEMFFITYSVWYSGNIVLQCYLVVTYLVCVMARQSIRVTVTIQIGFMTLNCAIFLHILVTIVKLSLSFAALELKLILICLNSCWAGFQYTTINFEIIISLDWSMKLSI